MNAINQYIIGIGTNKAGTSSLFKYLGDHPSISPSIRKQLDYFFPRETASIDKVGVWKKRYHLAFEKKPKAIYHLDISPDYMYDPMVIKNIIKELDIDAVRILIMLRNPVDRMISMFNYSKQKGLINKNIRFEDYYHLLQKPITHSTLFNTLITGKYSEYLQVYYDTFPRKNIKVVFLEHLHANPKNVLKEICSWLHIDPEMYPDYNFTKENKSVQVRNHTFEKLYLSLHKKAINASFIYPRVYSLLKPLGKFSSRFVKKLNSTSNIQKIEFDFSILQNYYQEDIAKLKKLVQTELPWKKYID